MGGVFYAQPEPLIFLDDISLKNWTRPLHRDDSIGFVLQNFIVCDEGDADHDDNSVDISGDLVPCNHALATFNHENAFLIWPRDEIIDYHRVDRKFPSEGNIRHPVFGDFVPFNMGLGLLLDQNSLFCVILDIVVFDLDFRPILDQNPSFSIMPNQNIWQNFGVVIETQNSDPIIRILEYFVELNPAIAAEIFIGPGDNSLAIIVTDDIVVDQGGWADNIDSLLIFQDFALDDWCSIANRDPDPIPFVLLNNRFENSRVPLDPKTTYSRISISANFAPFDLDIAFWSGFYLDPTQWVVGNFGVDNFTFAVVDQNSKGREGFTSQNFTMVNQDPAWFCGRYHKWNRKIETFLGWTKENFIKRYQPRVELGSATWWGWLY